MTNATFVLRNNFSALRVSKAGCPTIGVIVGCERLSMILSAEDIIYLFDEEYYPRVGILSAALSVVEAAGFLHLRK